LVNRIFCWFSYWICFNWNLNRLWICIRVCRGCSVFYDLTHCYFFISYQQCIFLVIFYSRFLLDLYLLIVAVISLAILF
jgi:hypothetical protein